MFSIRLRCTTYTCYGSSCYEREWEGRRKKKKREEKEKKRTLRIFTANSSSHFRFFFFLLIPRSFHPLFFFSFATSKSSQSHRPRLKLVAIRQAFLFFLSPDDIK